jgi:hypothetical protein
MEEMSIFHEMDYLRYLEISASKISNFSSDTQLQIEQKEFLESKKDICNNSIFYIYILLKKLKNLFYSNSINPKL